MMSVATTRCSLNELTEFQWLCLFLGLSGFRTFPHSILDRVLSRVRAEAVESGDPPKELRDWFFNPRSPSMYSEQTERTIFVMKKNGLACGWSGTDELEIRVPPTTLSDYTLSRLSEDDHETAKKWARRFREILLESCRERGITDLPRP